MAPPRADNEMRIEMENTHWILPLISVEYMYVQTIGSRPPTKKMLIEIESSASGTRMKILL